MVVLNAVQSVLSILVMISIGFLLTWVKWFDENTSKLFSKLVVNVSLPALMITNLMNTFSRDQLSQAGLGLVVPFLVILISFGIAVLVSRMLKVDPSRRGVFQTMFAFSNTIFIGLPVNTALFGDKSLPFVLFYYIANTTLFWTIGVYSIQQDAGDRRDPIFSMHTLRRIFSPPFLAFLFAVILIFMKIQLPKFLMDAGKYIGNLTTPLSMLFIGIIIYTIVSQGFYFDKGMIGILLGRFAITPLLVFVIVYFFPIPNLMKNVFVIQSALPVMTQTAIIAQAYHSDEKFAAAMATITTLACLIFVPFYMYLLNG